MLIGLNNSGQKGALLFGEPCFLGAAGDVLIYYDSNVLDWNFWKRIGNCVLLQR
jgi:hypothetical protein